MTVDNSVPQGEVGPRRTFTTKIIEVDGEAALEFPEEIVSRLGLKEGDTLSLEVVDGRLQMVPILETSEAT